MVTDGSAAGRALPLDGPFRLGAWLVEPRLNRLTRNGESIQIELKMMDVLVCLATHAGDLVERQQLIDTVWATEFISENILTRAVAELRRTLGDDAKEPRYIETIHRRGYRLIAPIQPVTATVHPFPTPTPRAAEERSPYPGLAAFTEEDAEFFFGREAEVAQLWRRITTRRLLAIIGPSGVGKSSLLRAGLVPAAPEGWRAVLLQPGDTPDRALARALAPELRDDPDAIAKLVDIRDDDTAVAVLSRWRGLHEHVLLVVDQFEELFTQNPPDVQERFSILLRRFADQADVNVLLSMRDDFLIACNDRAALAPIFSELTPITTPSRNALRRAVVSPAATAGFTFEGEELVDEMLDAVEGEQAALPMLAFTVDRLWEERDRDRRLLTRETYQRIGGVQGSLALHAEQVLASIGGDRVPIVRELFRNLVTAQGTRATREVDDLLSVFEDRAAASEVLSALTDARLLNASEITDDQGRSNRVVDIIHESLLANWPRLVRWQTQDADAAQLRDQLRQAAKTWDEHGRTDDMLWTGSAFREFAVWRERYPGGLSQLEEAFVSAMNSMATRRKRRRRVAATAAVVLALLVAAVFGTLWQRSVQETRRAEAEKLLALAQVALDPDPTEALAYATSSLTLADTREARTFVLRALWTAPPARVLTAEPNAARAASFSPDGRRLAAAGYLPEVLVWPETGGEPIRLPGHHLRPGAPTVVSWFGNDYLVTHNSHDPSVRVWSMPEGRLVRTIELPESHSCEVGDRHLFAEIGSRGAGPIELRRWALPGGEPESLGSVDITALDITSSAFESTGDRWIFTRGPEVHAWTLPLRDDDPGVLIGRHEHNAFLTDQEPGCIWSRDLTTFESRCWSITKPDAEPLAVIPPPPGSGRYLVRDQSTTWRTTTGTETHGTAPEIWYLDTLAGARSVPLHQRASWYGSGEMAVHPAGRWMVTTTGQWETLVFWPLVKTYPAVIDVKQGFPGNTKPFACSPDGGWIVAPFGKPSLQLRLWRVRPTGFDDVRDLTEPGSTAAIDSDAPSWPRFPTVRIFFDPKGERLVTTANGTNLFIVPLDGSEARRLEGFSDDHVLWDAAFSPSGRLVAVGTTAAGVEPKALRIWDLDTGETRVFEEESPEVVWIHTLAFTDETTLFSAGPNGVRRWNLETGAVEEVVQGGNEGMFFSADRRTMLTITEPADPHPAAKPKVRIHDLETGTSRDLEMALGPLRRGLAIDLDAEILVQALTDDSVRVGRLDASEPHLLFGHEGQVDSVAISPDRAWIASSGEDNTIRLWPMPDLSKPPLHTLPHDELIAKLHSLTNLRAVRDEASSTGWKIEVGPFPGWAEMPTW